MTSRKTHMAKMTRPAAKSRVRSAVNLNSQHEKKKFLMALAAKSGPKSMKVVGTRIKRGIKAALKSIDSDE